MAEREVRLKISLKDDLSAALKKVVSGAKAQIGTIGKGVPQNIPTATPSGGNGFGQLLQANLLSSAISSVAQGVLSAGQQLVGAIGQQFQATADMARSQLGATSANAALLGIGFQESAQMTEKISGTLAQSAIKLPGATKDYLDAFNGVSDTLVLSGGLTKKGLTDAGKEMIELTAMLGQASGAGSGVTSTVLGKMLGDTGSEALFRIDAFEKVPAFKAILEKDLSTAGKTLGDFFKMSAQDKQLALVGVKKKLFSQSYIDEMNLAADAQLDTIGSQLFDPVSGLFGFLRKIKIDGSATNVWIEVGKLIGTVKDLATGILRELGFTGDPLVGILTGLKRLNDFLRPIEKDLNNDGLSAIDFDLGKVASDMVSNLTKMIGGWVSGLVSAVEGAGGAAMAGKQLSDAITKGTQILSANFPAIVKTVAIPLLQMAIEFLAGYLVGQIMNIPATMISIWSAITNASIEVGIWIGSKIMESFSGLVPAIGNWATQLQGYFSGIWGSIVSSLSGIKDGVSGTVSRFIDGFKSAFLSGIEGVKSAIAAMWENLKSAIGRMASEVGTNAVASVVPGGSVVKAGFDLGGAIKGIFGGYSGQNMGLLNREMMGSLSGINRVGTAYRGNLLEAINQENRMKPSGSSLTIANSSELIVPRDRIKDLQQQPTINLQISGNTIQELHRSLDRGIQQIRKQPKLSMV